MKDHNRVLPGFPRTGDIQSPVKKSGTHFPDQFNRDLETLQVTADWQERQMIRLLKKRRTQKVESALNELCARSRQLNRDFTKFLERNA